MSKKRKQESRKERKKRISKNESSFYEKYNTKKLEFKMPETWDEAVAMGVLK